MLKIVTVSVDMILVLENVVVEQVFKSLFG